MKTYSPITVFAGRAHGITEPRRIGCEHDTSASTRGHAADHGGLRGHSIGDTYPWRVIGLGDGWAVEDCRGNVVFQNSGFQACEIAHAKARILKSLYPKGHTGA